MVETHPGDTQKHPRQRGLWIGLGLLSVLLLFSAGALLVGLHIVGSWLGRYAVREARSRGVELRIGGLDWGIDGLTLTRSQVSLVGVEQVAATVERIEASVRGWVNHARYGNTWGLRRAVFSGLPFPRRQQ